MADFALSTAWALAGWILGAAEVAAFLAVATPVEQPILLGLVVEAGIGVVKIMSFFIPGSIGAQEGGIVWLFTAIGAPRETGLAYAVFRRVRELVWIGIGFGCLGWSVRRAEGSLQPGEEAELSG
jgi:uncharacterized membrane protein YbhN (UPF0104 family)